MKPPVTQDQIAALLARGVAGTHGPAGSTWIVRPATGSWLAEGLLAPSAPVITPELPQAVSTEALLGSILLEISIMKRLQPDSLAVALRPSPGTEIFLRLTARAGRIEAFARHERGDFGRLSSLWPELQSHLRPHGVWLLDLSQRGALPHQTAGTEATDLPHKPQLKVAKARKRTSGLPPRVIPPPLHPQL